MVIGRYTIHYIHFSLTLWNEFEFYNVNRKGKKITIAHFKPISIIYELAIPRVGEVFSHMIIRFFVIGFI